MHICPNCKNTSEIPSNFCPMCGTAMVEKAPTAEPIVETQAPAEPQPAPVPDEPAYTAQPQAPAYTAPAYTAHPQPVSYAYAEAPNPPVPLGKVIAGMAISIAGLVFAAIQILYTLMFLAVEPEAALVFAIVFSIFSLPLSIVGLILSKSCVNAGSTSSMAKVGKTLGLIGVILAAASLSIGFLAIFGEM